MTRVFVDTNVFLRFLTQDDAGQSVEAERLFLGARDGRVRLVTGPPVLFELVWTLRRAYKVARGKTLEILSSLLAWEELELTDRALVEAAVERARAPPDRSSPMPTSLASLTQQAPGRSPPSTGETLRRWPPTCTPGDAPPPTGPAADVGDSSGLGGAVSAAACGRRARPPGAAAWRNVSGSGPAPAATSSASFQRQGGVGAQAKAGGVLPVRVDVEPGDDPLARVALGEGLGLRHGPRRGARKSTRTGTPRIGVAIRVTLVHPLVMRIGVQRVDPSIATFGVARPPGDGAGMCEVLP